MIDFEAAMCDPSTHFKHPADVLRQPQWSHAEKRLLLRQWAYDLKQQSRASEENMLSDQDQDDLLPQINQLLEQLGESRLFTGGNTGTRHSAQQ